MWMGYDMFQVSWVLVAMALCCVLTLSTRAQNIVPPELAAMADAEREFARTATVKGWRDAFLDFFAEDSIAFAPQVVPARDRLRKQPSTPFSELELVWEPRTGDVAAAGDLGWLTGPSTSINHKTPDKKPGYGCYLSVWRKQPDGRWKVYIDVGANSPTPVPFPAGFTRTTLENPYVGKDSKAAATGSLADADRALNAQIADQGMVRAFESVLAPVARFHRPGFVPPVGRKPIARWLEQHATAGTAKHEAAEAAASADFGYSYGRFEVKGPTPAGGVYVRLWSRDANGRWWLMVDIAQPFKPDQL
jgi:ketosteroid isomerase-like protein